MMNKKRILFWVLLAGFIVGALFWFFHVPYRPDRLYHVIPPNAEFVIRHDQLAERWDDFSANPLARALFTSMGLDPEELTEWGDDPELRVWMDKLLARHVLITHVPELGPGRDPAWVLTGWIGGESIRLRWLLTRGRLAGMEMVPREAGGAYWLVDTDEDDEHLSISVVEGMLIGVLSRDPHAVRGILDVYDGIAPRHPMARKDVREDAGPCGNDAHPDRGWFIGPTERGDRAKYFFAFEQVDERGVRGALCRREPGEMAPMVTRDIEVPSQFFGAVPFFMVGMHPESGAGLWLNRLPPAVQTVFREMQEEEDAELLLLAATGGAYAGSIAGLSVPAVLAAWPIRDESAALTRMNTVLDRLNAAFRWGLVTTETRVAGRSVHVVESTTDTPYANVRFRERVAFSMVDGWMVLASHASALMPLLERYEQPEAVIEADLGGWQREVRAGDAAIYGYADISGGARTLRMAISAWSMKLMFDDPRGTRETRQRLNEARAWIDTLEPLSGAHLWLDQQEDWLALRFALGEYMEEDE